MLGLWIRSALEGGLGEQSRLKAEEGLEGKRNVKKYHIRGVGVLEMYVSAKPPIHDVQRPWQVVHWRLSGDEAVEECIV